MNTAPNNHLQEDYQRARQRCVADGWLTMLHIGSDESALLFGHRDDAPAVVRLRLGSAALARDVLRHDPPTPLEIEHAIAAIEDEVMPLAKRLPPSSVWVASGAAVHELVAGADSLTLANVERLFQQLAAVAEGRPAASGGVPTGAAFVASVLILRECMHHLHFESAGVL